MHQHIRLAPLFLLRLRRVAPLLPVAADKRLCAASPSTCGLLDAARSAPRSCQHVRRLPAYKRQGTSPIRRVTGSCQGTTWLAGSASLGKRLQGLSPFLRDQCGRRRREKEILAGVGL
ncbi:unnamed protein product [Closterium sp. Yama58-4]|nr:unnamed protein product [Closterium sp. Yama58-4]